MNPAHPVSERAFHPELGAISEAGALGHTGGTLELPFTSFFSTGFFCDLLAGDR